MNHHFFQKKHEKFTLHFIPLLKTNDLTNIKSYYRNDKSPERTEK